MSVSTTTNSSILSNARTYIIPVLIVVIGIMIAMGNMFSSQAATVPSTTHNSTTAITTTAFHVSGSTVGGALK